MVQMDANDFGGGGGGGGGWFCLKVMGGRGKGNVGWFRNGTWKEVEMENIRGSEEKTKKRNMKKCFGDDFLKGEK